MNPAELAAVLLDLVRRATAERGAGPDSDLRPGCRARAPAQPRPRRLGLQHRHEARASRSASNPRELADRDRRAARADRRRRRGRRRRPGLHQHHPRRGCRRCAREDDRRAGRATTATATSTPASRINLEFVSANPTGPIHIGGVRWAAVGDSLARIFQAQGGIVTREYYFNDHGAQIDRFARSLVASYLGEPAPEDGYGGDYIAEIAARVDRRLPRRPRRTCRATSCRRSSAAVGVELMFGDIKASLHDFGVDFDVYFHENDLHEIGRRRARDRPPARARPHLRGRWRDLAAHDRVRRRPRPRRHQERRRGRLHRGRPRLLPQQARARLRAQPHHARRRPPRLRAAASWR